MNEGSARAGLFLASSSPRRAALLHQIGVSFEVIKPEIDETSFAHESPEALVERLASAKAKAGFFSTCVANQDDCVLAADTIVVCGDTVLGKPNDEQQAKRMLALLSGRSHRVLTAVALIDGQRERHCLSETIVTFRRFSDAEIDMYWQSGEPIDKAGAYGIQGIGAIFVEHINGSYSGVVGLPLCETHSLLTEFDIC